MLDDKPIDIKTADRGFEPNPEFNVRLWKTHKSKTGKQTESPIPTEPGIQPAGNLAGVQECPKCNSCKNLTNVPPGLAKRNHMRHKDTGCQAAGPDECLTPGASHDEINEINSSPADTDSPCSLNDCDPVVSQIIELKGKNLHNIFTTNSATLHCLKKEDSKDNCINITICSKDCSNNGSKLGYSPFNYEEDDSSNDSGNSTALESKELGRRKQKERKNIIKCDCPKPGSKNDKNVKTAKKNNPKSHNNNKSIAQTNNKYKNNLRNEIINWYNSIPNPIERTEEVKCLMQELQNFKKSNFFNNFEKKIDNLTVVLDKKVKESPSTDIQCVTNELVERIVRINAKSTVDTPLVATTNAPTHPSMHPSMHRSMNPSMHPFMSGAGTPGAGTSGAGASYGSMPGADTLGADTTGAETPNANSTGSIKCCEGSCLRNIVLRWCVMCQICPKEVDKIIELVKDPKQDKKLLKSQLVQYLCSLERKEAKNVKYLEKYADMLLEMLKYERDDKIKKSTKAMSMVGVKLTVVASNPEVNNTKVNRYQCMSAKIDANTNYEIPSSHKPKRKFNISKGVWTVVITTDIVENKTDIVMEQAKNSNILSSKSVICNIDAAASNIMNDNSNHLRMYIDKTFETVRNASDSMINCDSENKLYPLVRSFSAVTSFPFTVFHVTSTPKQAKYKEIQKLNPEEIQYTNDLSNLIRAWIGTLPPREDLEDVEFREVMIMELATEISDLTKYNQLTGAIQENRGDYVMFLVHKWINKLNVYEINEVMPQIKVLAGKICEVPEPVLTRPQYGNRKQMQNVIFNEQNPDIMQEFVPTASDVLEDAISIWINDLPSDVLNTTCCNKGAKVHELAEALRPKLEAKRPEFEIQSEVQQWLNGVIKDDRRNEVEELATDLKYRIIELPQDATLQRQDAQRKADFADIRSIPPVAEKSLIIESDDPTLDDTMAQFIVTYIDRNHDVEDPMARAAFADLLKKELFRLTPEAKEQLYISPEMAPQHQRLAREKLLKELDYIKIVSDWLKTMPVQPTFNRPKNKDRVDFVLSLAKTIQEVEDEKLAEPDAMDYDTYLVPTIQEYIFILPLTISKKDKYISYEIQQLLNKIIEHRLVVEERRKNETLDTSGIHTDNIGDFIEENIKINGGDIGEDELKMEAWCVRLLREIKCMVREGVEPSKAEAWRRLGTVPPPGDASVALFASELRYIELVSDWIRNLPLTRAAHDDSLASMITELAETMAAMDSQPQTPEAEREFESYVQRWIDQLPLDRSQPIVFPVLMQQLNKKMKRLKNVDDSIIIHKSPNVQSPKSKESLKSKKSSKTKILKHPEELAVNAIQKWASSLPIKTDNSKHDTIVKTEVANRMLHKVGECSVDPRIAHDQVLYEHMVRDEVDSIVETLPPSQELDKKKQQLNQELIKTLVDAKSAMKEKNEGDAYRHRLENEVGVCLPPEVRETPEGELYKRRVADQFIVDNLARSSTATERYSRQLGAETAAAARALRQSAAARREGYGALFRVSVSEAGAAQALRGAATRAAARAWRGRLPPSRVPTDPLAHDTELAGLATRIVELKQNHTSDKKILKEIIKYLDQQDIPEFGQNDKKQFAKALQHELKATDKDLACAKAYKSKKGKGKGKGKSNRYSSDEVVTWNSHDDPKREAGDVIYEIIQEWTLKIPLSGVTPEDSVQVRNNIITKVMGKVSELNNNPSTLNDDFIYNELLDQEMENIFSTLPICCKSEIKGPLKSNLICSLRDVKPLVREEQAKTFYRHNLNQVLEQELAPDKPTNLTGDKSMKYNLLKENIIDNFIELEFDRDDADAQCDYKAGIDEALGKYWREVAGIEVTDPLFRRNRLVWALGAVRGPGERALRDELDELRVRREVSKLFHDTGTRPDARALSTLAKRLTQFERSGHFPVNEAKMRQEIVKSLKKLDKDIKPDRAQKFIEELAKTEPARKTKVITNRSTGLENDNKSSDEFSSGVSSRSSCKSSSSDDVSPSSSGHILPKAEVKYECPNLNLLTRQRSNHARPSADLASQTSCMGNENYEQATNTKQGENECNVIATRRNSDVNYDEDDDDCVCPKRENRALRMMRYCMMRRQHLMQRHNITSLCFDHNFCVAMPDYEFFY